MKTILKILLIINLLLLGNINAKEQYSTEQIQKHLETIFNKNIRYEKQHQLRRFNIFKEKIVLYYEFADSIKQRDKKVEILQKVAKKFEKLTNIGIELRYGKPDVKTYMGNNQRTIQYGSPKALVEEVIHFSFANKEEIYTNLKSGYWSKFFTSRAGTYQKTLNFIKNQKNISLAYARNIGIFVKHFHIIELNDTREKYFEKLIEKEFFFSFFGESGRWNYSIHIQPSIFNDREDDFSKDQISQFDWIMLDEFYHNKKLQLLMFYKTGVIPILTDAIYNRLKEE